jgi:hypothetical protein
MAMTRKGGGIAMYRYVILAALILTLLFFALAWV